MVKVKICGLTRPCDIETVNIEKPDYIGFVFADSRRKVSPGQAMTLRKGLRPEITPVGVFVDEAMENIIALMRNGIIGAVQLHGSEDEAYIEKLKSRTDKPIIKAIAVEQKGDLHKWDSTAADYLLLDNKTGGSGRAFDWALIGETVKPFFLAGGLNIENVAEAMHRAKPFAVDVSSGVEADGTKDSEKIINFIRMVRNA